jgi:hypothetical protein
MVLAEHLDTLLTFPAKKYDERAEGLRIPTLLIVYFTCPASTPENKDWRPLLDRGAHSFPDICINRLVNIELLVSCGEYSV